MGTLLALSAFAVAACFIFAILALVGLVLKTVLWIVFFPIRFLLKLVFWILSIGLGVLLLPVVLVVAGIALIGAILAAIFSLLAPLLPIGIVALVGWGIYRASTRRPSPVI
jgi:hypothetical protein